MARVVSSKPKGSNARQAMSYRGKRRNIQFGRKAVGNTTPAERRRMWGLK